MFDPRVLQSGLGRAPNLLVCAHVTQHTSSSPSNFRQLAPSAQEKLPPPGDPSKLPPSLAISTQQGSVPGQRPAPPVTQSTLHGSVERSLGHSSCGLGEVAPQQGQQGVQAWGEDSPKSHFLGRVSAYASSPLLLPPADAGVKPRESP